MSFLTFKDNVANAKDGVKSIGIGISPISTFANPSFPPSLPFPPDALNALTTARTPECPFASSALASLHPVATLATAHGGRSASSSLPNRTSNPPGVLSVAHRQRRTVAAGARGRPRSEMIFSSVLESPRMQGRVDPRGCAVGFSRASWKMIDV